MGTEDHPAWVKNDEAQGKGLDPTDLGSSRPSAAAEDEDSDQDAGYGQAHAKDQEGCPSLLDGAGEDVEVLSPKARQERDGQENGGYRGEPTAHHGQVIACQRRLQAQQRNAPLLDRREVGHKPLQFVTEILEVHLGFGGCPRQRQDQRHPGRQVPAWYQGLAHLGGLVPDGGDLGQVVVVGLAQHLLLHRVQPFVQPHDERRERIVQRTDQAMHRLDGVGFQQRPHACFLAQGIQGRARGPVQGDQEPGRVIAVHLNRLAQLLVEPEADHHGDAAVDLQLPPLAELLGVLHRQRVQSQTGGEPVDDLVGRVLDVEPEGPAILDELPDERRWGLLQDVGAVIDPAAHGYGAAVWLPCSASWSSFSSSLDREVFKTVPPYLLSASTALSGVAFSSIKNSAEVPGWTMPRTWSWNCWSMLVLVTFPISAPSPAPTAMPKTGMKNSKPNRNPQNRPQLAPLVIGWWLVVTW